MKRIILLCLLGLLLPLALASGAVAQSGATLTTDKPDYAPGEVALISGAGFLPGELIDLSIAIQDPDTGEWAADWDWAQGYCSEDGAFVAEYLVPDRALAKSLRATAMGLSSGLIASVTFTDAAAANVNFATLGLPPATSVTVTWNGTNNGGNSISGPTTFSSPGPTANIGTLQGSTFTYSFPASITAGGDTYDLDSTSPESPFTTPSGDPPIPTTTVTATYVKYVPPSPEPTNSPPTISASDLDLGQVVGCLVDGSFQVTQDIAVDDFDPITSDPDGDPVTVTLDVSSVTLIGPGLAEVEVTLTATDDPSARNTATTTLTPLSTSTTVKVKAQVIYNFVGFLSPLSLEGSLTARLVKQGATVPVKFQLSDCCGVAITDLNLSGMGWPEIDVCYQQGNAPNGDPDITDAGTSNDDGICFRYADPNWIYNLKTTTSYCVGNTYKIVVTLDDGTTHEAYISIKK
jgi:hypothetical protein